MNKIKNIDFEKALDLRDMVTCATGQVVSRTLAQNSAVSLTLFAFDAGEEIFAHTSHGDAMVCVLEGEADITIGDATHRVAAGQTIVMPAEVPHAVAAATPMKFLLTVVFLKGHGIGIADKHL